MRVGQVHKIALAFIAAGLTSLAPQDCFAASTRSIRGLFEAFPNEPLEDASVETSVLPTTEAIIDAPTNAVATTIASEPAPSPVSETASQPVVTTTQATNIGSSAGSTTASPTLKLAAADQADTASTTAGASTSTESTAYYTLGLKGVSCKSFFSSGKKDDFAKIIGDQVSLGVTSVSAQDNANDSPDCYVTFVIVLPTTNASELQVRLKDASVQQRIVDGGKSYFPDFQSLIYSGGNVAEGGATSKSNTDTSKKDGSSSNTENGPSTNAASAESKSGGVSSGLIAGIVVGVVVLIAGIVAGLFIYRRRQQNARSESFDKLPSDRAAPMLAAGASTSDTATTARSFGASTGRGSGGSLQAAPVPIPAGIAAVPSNNSSMSSANASTGPPSSGSSSYVNNAPTVIAATPSSSLYAHPRPISSPPSQAAPLEAALARSEVSRTSGASSAYSAPQRTSAGSSTYAAPQQSSQPQEQVPEGTRYSQATFAAHSRQVFSNIFALNGAGASQPRYVAPETVVRREQHSITIDDSVKSSETGYDDGEELNRRYNTGKNDNGTWISTASSEFNVDGDDDGSHSHHPATGPAGASALPSPVNPPRRRHESDVYEF